MANRAKKRSNRSIRIVVYENHVLKLYLCSRRKLKRDESVRREVGKAKDESTTTLLLDDLMKTTCVNYVRTYIIFISSICTVAYITNERENYFSVNSFSPERKYKCFSYHTFFITPQTISLHKRE